MGPWPNEASPKRVWGSKHAAPKTLAPMTLVPKPLAPKALMLKPLAQKPPVPKALAPKPLVPRTLAPDPVATVPQGGRSLRSRRWRQNPSYSKYYEHECSCQTCLMMLVLS